MYLCNKTCFRGSICRAWWSYRIETCCSKIVLINTKEICCVWQNLWSQYICVETTTECKKWTLTLRYILILILSSLNFYSRLELKLEDKQLQLRLNLGQDTVAPGSHSSLICWASSTTCFSPSPPALGGWSKELSAVTANFKAPEVLKCTKI
jgi:hypothetical protein